MKKLALVGLVLVVLASSVGCWGPNKLTRDVDDLTNQMYVDTPWLSLPLLIVAPIVQYFAFFVDAVVLNTIDFWGTSAFRGYGTAYEHKNPTMPSGK